MTCLEHLLENGLIVIKENARDEWMKIMLNDPNLPYTKMNLNDLWEICQYIEYTYCAFCDSPKGVYDE